MNAFFQSAVFALCLGQPDPGTIVVVADDLAVVTFPLSGGTPYRVDYPTSLEALWFDRGMASPALPATTYTARNKGDFNGDHLLDGRDIQGFSAAVINGVFDTRGDFNEDGQLNGQDVPGFVEASLGAYPAEGVILYAQGLSPSSAIGDARIDLLTDPDMNGSFTLAQSRLATVVDLSISPLFGHIGTVVTLNLAPALAPLTFNASTSATWSGQFEPLAGNSPPPFQIHYSAAQFREQSGSEAQILVGEGTAQNLPTPESFGTTGQVIGSIRVNLTGRTISKNANFSFQLSAEWHEVAVDDFGLRSLGGIPDVMPIFFIDPLDPASSVADLPEAFWHFRILALKIAENGTTLANAPQQITVSVKNLDAAGTVVAQASVVLSRPPGDDGDPGNIVYHSDLDRPIVFTSTVVNPANVPEVLPMRGVVGGRAIATP